MVVGEKGSLLNEEDCPMSRSIPSGKFGLLSEFRMESGGGVGKRPAFCF